MADLTEVLTGHCPFKKLLNISQKKAPVFVKYYLKPRSACSAFVKFCGEKGMNHLGHIIISCQPINNVNHLQQSRTRTGNINGGSSKKIFNGHNELWVSRTHKQNQLINYKLSELKTITFTNTHTASSCK